MAVKYFRNFPLTDLELDTRSVKILDIYRSSRVIPKIMENPIAFNPYIISDGEIPEELANRWYGSPYYYWVIFLSNNIHDRFRDWPKTQTQLQKYINQKYGMTKTYIHHYEDANGLWQDSGNPVTIEDYEFLLNDEKRNIKYFNVKYLPQLERELSSLIG